MCERQEEEKNDDREKEEEEERGWGVGETRAKSDRERKA